MDLSLSLCQDCAARYEELRSWLDAESEPWNSRHRDYTISAARGEKWISVLRAWESLEDYKDNCSFCKFVAGLKHERHDRCDAVSHERVTLILHTLLNDNFVRPPTKETVYLDFEWSCKASLWCFLEYEDRIEGTIGFAHQVNPKLDETDWNVIRQWVDGCLQRHQSDCICQDPFDVPGFEVIDCTTRRLVPWDKKADFAALSYVWGSTQTQADRLKDLLETPADRTILPNPCPERVIEDALVCASKLNIHYLWVDRYCIDQEVTSDTKQRLIQSMDKIYSAAKVTIINVAGNDALNGLPGVSETLRRTSSSRGFIGNHTIIPVFNPNTEIQSSKWSKRGWTLQEGLLARRRLIFTNTGVYYQCTRSHYVEGLSGEFRSNEEDRFAMIHPDLRMETQAFPRSVIGSDSSTLSMLSVCNAFTGRDLKTDEDALNACLGIFSRFWTSKKPRYQYCGLPFGAKSDAAFILSLLLTAGRMYENSTPFRRAWGPSWSFLAWRDCRFSGNDLQGMSREFKTCVDIKLPKHHEEQDVMSTVSDYVNEIDSGGLFQHWLPYLRLSGWIATMRFENTYSRSNDKFNAAVLCCIAEEGWYIGSGRISQQMWAKALTDNEKFKSSRLLDVIFVTDDGTDIYCLVIQRIGEETADTFERIGSCWIFYVSPEVKQVQNKYYLAASDGRLDWKYHGKPGEIRNLECRFDTITLL